MAIFEEILVQNSSGDMDCNTMGICEDIFENPLIEPYFRYFKSPVNGRKLSHVNSPDKFKNLMYFFS